MNKSELLQGRDAIWYCIRKLKTFSAFDIEVMSTDCVVTHNINNATARTYIKSLQKAGFIEALPRKPGVHSRQDYMLVKDIGQHAPQVRRDGSLIRDTKRNQLWRAIRILKKFDAHSLIASTDNDIAIKYSDAKDYILHLHKAGYLHQIEPAINGHLPAKYSLLSAMNTGPKPPQVQRVKQVFDPNLNKVVWPKDGE